MGLSLSAVRRGQGEHSGEEARLSTYYYCLSMYVASSRSTSVARHIILGSSLDEPDCGSLAPHTVGAVMIAIGAVSALLMMI
jgi:hypothetical protein